MLRGVFVTGTDTGVGKTVVAAALMHRYRPAFPVRYWKPIQTGVERDDDTRAVRRLGGCASAEVIDRGTRLRRPVSPHLAAALSGTKIELQPLLDIAAEYASGRQRWIVEGAGGVLVPLNDSQLMVDLMARVGLPVVLVARSRLGTINHTLLSLEALRARGLAVAGVVMTGPLNAANRQAIERYGAVPVLGELPRLAPLTPAAVKKWAVTRLDPDRQLQERLK